MSDGEKALQFAVQLPEKSVLMLDTAHWKMEQRPTRIAFGSCNHQDHRNDLWPVIAERNPTAFIWGGDAIYADSEGSTDWSHFPPTSTHEQATPGRLNYLYRKQRRVPGYQNLLEQNVTIFGTFDGELNLCCIRTVFPPEISCVLY